MVVTQISRRTQGAINMKFTIYKDIKGEFRWSLIAKNGKILGDSGEGYKRKGKCRRIIERIILNVGTAKIIE